MLAKSTAWVENPFPALEFIQLRSPHEPIVLPNAFLIGESDGPPRRLREIVLCNVSLPHCLLRPNCDLVSLHLVAGAGSLLAEDLAAALSETHQLKSLSVRSYPLTTSYPDSH